MAASHCWLDGPGWLDFSQRPRRLGRRVASCAKPRRCAASKGLEDALRNGVLTLLIPVALLLIGAALLVWRKSIPATDPQ